MKGINQNHKKSIGIDISKGKFDTYALPAGIHNVFKNNDLGIRACIQWIREQEDTNVVVYEATGGYERQLHLALHEAGICGWMVQPRHVKYYSKIH